MQPSLTELIEFADNPEPRCPVVLCLDTSGSMTGDPIKELNTGLQLFKKNLEQDQLAARRVEVGIVTFASQINRIQDFITVDQFVAPILTAHGTTCMGAGLEEALNMVEQRKAEYRTNGVSFYRPWLLTITDAAPTDDVSLAATRIREAETNKRVAFFAVGVEGADMARLATISVRPPRKLNGLNFGELFVWLSRSLESVAASQPGDQLALPPIGWATI